MVHKLAKVIYKPNTESTDEYIVIANPEEVRIHLATYRSFLITTFSI